MRNPSIALHLLSSFPQFGSTPKTKFPFSRKSFDNIPVPEPISATIQEDVKLIYPLKNLIISAG